MSAFMVEDQERQRKMNKMTDGKCSKMILGDVQRIWEDLLESFYFTLPWQLFWQSFYNTVGYSIGNFLNED